jgi:hypothetical protein
MPNVDAIKKFVFNQPINKKRSMGILDGKGENKAGEIRQNM